MFKGLKDILVLVGVTVVSTTLLWVTVGSKTIYQNFDGPYYAVVAKCLYDRSCISSNFSFPLPLEYYPAHFPLFPILIKALQPVGLLRAAVLVNVLATMAGAVTVYLIWMKMKWGNGLLAALVWLFMWPRMWVVRSVGSPETLFVLLTLLSLYSFGQKKYLWAGVWGALSALTKSPGVLLFIAYCMSLIANNWKAKKIIWSAWPILLIPLALVGLFWFYQVRTGDFWAYFNSGDNIHLQTMPFRVFDSGQSSWVGTFWLEDVLWVYLIGAIGVYKAFRKNAVWGWYGAVLLTSILFVSHRDISRYSLPLVPVVLLGFSEVLEQKEVKRVLAWILIPMFFYSVNFLSHNAVAIADWGMFL